MTLDTRYAAMFARAARARRGVLVPFWMLGDPTPMRSLEIIDALIEAGADALELGIPFSDPVADGPVVQAAAARALAAGTTPTRALELIARLREQHPLLPIGLLGYLNPLVARGPQAFLGAAAAAGVDSLLLADLASVECAPYAALMRGVGIAPVLMVPPNATAATFAAVAAHGAGYAYVAGRAGVTGTHAAMQAPTAALIARLRAVGAPPALVGFGISAPAQVRAAYAVGAAGAIVGSTLVALGDDPVAVAQRFTQLRAA